MPELPHDWRERTVRMIAGTDPLSGELFTGGPVLSPVAQIGVYRSQYQLRLADAAIYELRGLESLVGDGMRALVLDFLRANPSQHFTLDRIADAMPQWLIERGAPPSHIDMARLDVAVSRAFGAADSQPLTVRALSDDPVLCLAPPAHLLRLSYSVFRTRSAALDDQPLPPLVDGDFPLVVFRPERQVRHLVLPQLAYALLERFMRPTPLSEALAAVASNPAAAHELSANLSAWMTTFARSHLLTAYRQS